MNDDLAGLEPGIAARVRALREREAEALFEETALLLAADCRRLEREHAASQARIRLARDSGADPRNHAEDAPARGVTGGSGSQ